ncbi:MAG: GGDEF domain-containing protein [Chloroflexi bacterium]|nr:GGDEF domain-containing protein [Chloroflexota bacterium]
MSMHHTPGVFHNSRRHRVRCQPMVIALACTGVAAMVVASGDSEPAAVSLFFAGILGQAPISFRWGWRWALLVVVPAAMAFWWLLSVREVTDLTIAIGLVGLAGLGAANIAISELGYLTRALRRVNVVDPVTRLGNYDLFVTTLHHELPRSARYRAPFSLILIEAPELNAIAQQQGYRKLDLALQEIARVLDSSLRDSDVLARLSGPAFGLLLPMTPREGAMVALERVREALRSWPPLTKMLGRPLEWHAAVVQFPVDGQTVDELLARGQAILNEMRPPERGTLELEQLAIYARELQQLYRVAKSNKLPLPIPPALEAPGGPGTGAPPRTA